MSGENMAQVAYHLEDKEKLFSIGYSIYVNRQGLLRKGEKVEKFPDMLRRALVRSALLGALIAIYLIIMLVNGVDFLGVALVAICVVYDVTLLKSWNKSRRDYAYAMDRFVRSGDESGTLCFDERGITDIGVSGEESFFSWSDYRYCILVDEAITILFTNEREELLMMSRDDQTEQAICQVLEAFGKEDTIRTLEMKGKKK